MQRIWADIWETCLPDVSILWEAGAAWLLVRISVGVWVEDSALPCCATSWSAWLPHSIVTLSPKQVSQEKQIRQMLFSKVGPHTHSVTSHMMFTRTTLRIHQDCVSGELEFSTWFWSGKLQGEYVELERSLCPFCKIHSNTGMLFIMSWAFFFLFMKPRSFLNVLYRYYFLSEMLYQQWVHRHIVITFSFQIKHSRIIWEESLVEETSLLDWPAGLSGWMD